MILLLMIVVATLLASRWLAGNCVVILRFSFYDLWLRITATIRTVLVNHKVGTNHYECLLRCNCRVRE